MDNTDGSGGKIVNALEGYGIGNPAEKAEKIEEFLGFVRERRDWAGLVSKSVSLLPEEAVVDSIGVAASISRGAGRVVEIGSGAGLLGIVTAIVQGDSEFTLVEASSRKAAFLAEARGRLGLDNVRVFAGRAEELTGREHFDVAMTRAVGRLTYTVPLALDLLAGGGIYMALKGSDVQADLEEAEELLKDLDSEVVEVVELTYRGRREGGPGTLLVVIRKM